MKKAKGYVYFVSAMHMIACGYFKVGITNNTSYKPRISQIQSNSPFLICIARVVTHSVPENLERMVLEEFKQHRIRGEWFAPTMFSCANLDETDNQRYARFESDVLRFMAENCDGEVIV